ELVSFLSQYITLRPGDLIYAGTQPPVDVIKPGDTVEVEVEGVGVLKNQVVADKD
ncbi:MAG: fumarylacetoacetate hydrolase family protein, partial [Candidatus Omnitrophica bacterium]|nr:fumarylacetoacetate hydrolase family protein [Candidatus Omnitrophota bacterium]